jgi:TolA-binding protein
LTRKLTLITTVKRDDSELGRKLLALGRLCKGNGKPSLARGIFQVVVARWEGSDAAKEAQQELESLQ